MCRRSFFRRPTHRIRIKSMTSRPILSILLITASASAFAANADAAMIPYTEDFNDETTTTSGTATPSEGGAENGTFALDSVAGLNPDNIASSFATWDVVSGNPDLNGTNQYQHSVSVETDGNNTVGLRSEAYINGTGFANVNTSPGGSFEVSYDFQIQDVDNNNSQTILRFDVLAASGGTSSNGYLVNWQLTGGTPGDLSISGGNSTTGGNDSTDTLTIVEDADDGTDENVPGGIGTGTTTYSMLIEGAFDDVTGDLSLTATLSDSNSNSISETLTDTNPLTGQFFGFRHDIFNASNDPDAASLTVNYDNLEIIPEPASLALMGLGGLFLAHRRR